MNIRIIRGTHQIGGIATEISTQTTRILIDMGDELSLDSNAQSALLDIPGITDNNGNCDGVLFTHYHGDHIGQMNRIRDGVPLYCGALAKEIMFSSADHQYESDDALCKRILSMNTFVGGEAFEIGDVRITPYCIDHSACDSYMFLIEADGKRVLYTGDFRMHGFRGKGLPKVLRKIGKIDVLITEGTTLSRTDSVPMTEHELQQKAKEYMEQYKYVFVMCSSTNLERICALSKIVPRRKYFVCDEYQYNLIELVEKHWSQRSPLYRNVKKTTYGNNIFEKLSDNGFLMIVRDNSEFRRIIKRFDPSQSIIIYSMWDGYRTKTNSSIADFLQLTNNWIPLHTSGHASHQDIQTLINESNPDIVIPIHTESPQAIKQLCPNRKVITPDDNTAIEI